MLMMLLMLLILLMPMSADTDADEFKETLGLQSIAFFCLNGLRSVCANMALSMQPNLLKRTLNNSNKKSKQ
jgi:hypothetical protein